MPSHTDRPRLSGVITASSLGTLIEWYDFYIFGSLAPIIATQFFPSANPTAALLSTLATFAAGFVVRPFGALVFGRLGDLVGRKYTFLTTLLLMGGSTFAIGLVPSYASIGFWAPLIVLILRLLQGLALGGEYGGAATYVAEHAPPGRRGFYTSWIQTTATLGLFLSLTIILLTRSLLSEEAFNDWGWRAPFWLSILMVGVSVVIRLRMQESPLFQKAKAEGTTSTNPLKESFGNRYNFKFVLLALFGATMGQGVVWYTGQFYALSFLQSVVGLDITRSSTIIMVALAAATPFFILFGHLSDQWGRKWIMLTGMLLAVLLYRPIYSAMYTAGTAPWSDTVCWILTALVFVQVLFVTMVYGPIAAFLVELFPVRIRYTSMSLPYHIGNGIFGGLLPAIATYLVTRAGGANKAAAAAGQPWPYEQPYLEGLWYPIIIGSVSLLIGALYIRDPKPSDHE